MPPLYPSPGPFPTHRALAAVSQAGCGEGSVEAEEMFCSKQTTARDATCWEEAVRRCYYETSSDRALHARPLSEAVGAAALGGLAKGVPQRILQEIRGENYLNVHAIGQRNTKRLRLAR